MREAVTVVGDGLADRDGVKPARSGAGEPLSASIAEQVRRPDPWVLVASIEDCGVWGLVGIRVALCDLDGLEPECAQLHTQSVERRGIDHEVVPVMHAR